VQAASWHCSWMKVADDGVGVGAGGGGGTGDVGAGPALHVFISNFSPFVLKMLLQVLMGFDVTTALPLQSDDV